jgi:hypothetical protein
LQSETTERNAAFDGLDEMGTPDFNDVFSEHIKKSKKRLEK